MNEYQPEREAQMDQRQRDRRVRKLAKALGSEFGEELGRANTYITSDPRGSLTKSRIVLEALLKQGYLEILGHPPKKPTLDAMLGTTQLKRKIDDRIQACMRSVQVKGNLGPHPNAPPKPRDAMSALDDVLEILEWCRENRPAWLAGLASDSKPVRSASSRTLLLGLLVLALGVTIAAASGVLSNIGWEVNQALTRPKATPVPRVLPSRRDLQPRRP